MNLEMENGVDEEEPMFDPQLLEQLDWNQKKSEFRNGVSPKNPGENLKLRPLMLADYDRGFMELLSQLTSIGDVSKATFEERFHSMKSSADTYYISVLEDIGSGRVIGCSSLITEQKFIHSAGSRGRIEDVVIHTDYRGKQLGKLMVETMTLLGKDRGCYKMSLECKPDNVKFYESFGYSPDGQYFMVQRYKD